MGRGAIVAAGNPWYEARIKASEHDERLSSREGAAEVLNMSVSALADAELDLTKRMPVEKAVLMAETYGSPELLNYYCKHECPIGNRRSLAEVPVGIERATVEITKALRKETVQGIKHRLQDIAADGEVSEEEIPALVEIIDDLQDLSLIISKLELIKDRALRRMQQEKSKGTTA